jgi:hypothetical protein
MVDSLSDTWGFDPAHWNTITRTRYNQIVGRVVENVTGAQQQQKAYYDRSSAADPLQAGDEVWVRQIRRSHKFAPMWRRGWRVMKVLSPQNVAIKSTSGEEKVIHREKVRKVQSREAEKEVPNFVECRVDERRANDEASEGGGLEHNATSNEEDIGGELKDEAAANEEDIGADIDRPEPVAEEGQGRPVAEEGQRRPVRQVMPPQRFMFESFE